MLTPDQLDAMDTILMDLCDELDLVSLEILASLSGYTIRECKNFLADYEIVL